MTSYLESYKFSPATMDVRDHEMHEATLRAGLPMHDLRAIDLVEKALLDLSGKTEFRTARKIEQDTRLPGELVKDILETVPVISRRSVLRNIANEPIYRHADLPRTWKEKAEELRRALAREGY